jgi:GT2 family glycosyltransferase
VNTLKVSVIIPTHNRPDKLGVTFDSVRRQTVAATDYEIIVVDDGSSPPVSLMRTDPLPSCVVVRLEGEERSAARNAGAKVARGGLLVFVDDDMVVASDFLSVHLSAQSEWPEALVVGAVRLPDELLATPFGRFRQKLEQNGIPLTRGLTGMRNFCTATNMSVSKRRFDEIGGFDPNIVSGEDQDFALRHTSRGGEIAFLPEADALHNDNALDIRGYCRRAEWGGAQMVPFCQRHSDLPDNVEREKVNGRLRREDALSRRFRKLIKSLLAITPVCAMLFGAASLFEHIAPNGWALDRIYRLLLGTHIFRGYRKGLRRYGDLSSARDCLSSALQRT